MSLIITAVTGILGCDHVTGPAGLTKCLLGTPYYTKYQYGTCLANVYIIQRSGGKHRCRDRAATYCYYPCMLEKYGIDKGPVYDDCLCDTTRQLQQPSRILPAGCYSPGGMDCNWYRECLHEMFDCTGPAEYAISYGEVYCNLYEQSKSRLSQKALHWLDAARKCLQDALVPVLHLCQVQPTCSDIRTRAFTSHVSCYVKPFEGISVCNLSVRDWLNIFMIVKGSFVSLAWVETLEASVLTASMCLRMFLT